MSILIDVFNAVIKLGLPLAGTSWLLFSRLYDQGDMDRNSAGRRAIKSQVKTLRATFKTAKKQRKGKPVVQDGEGAGDEQVAAIEPSPRNPANLLYEKWMWFGSGFYGLAALWTFCIIELSDLYNFLFHFPGLAALFGDGVLSLILNILLNQLENLVTAFVWFGYWDADSVLLWVLVAYLGYWLGLEGARREYRAPVAWVDQLRARLKR